MASSMNLTAVLVAILLLYLSTFILCAIIRITTGISIQRIGYFSLRRVAYAPRDGVHLAVRRLGVSLHRPSFAQPTWISLQLRELTVTIDPEALSTPRRAKTAAQESPLTPLDEDETLQSDRDEAAAPETEAEDEAEEGEKEAPRRKLWKQLSGAKQFMKRLHRQIKYLTLVDVVATDTTVRFVHAGEVHMGNLTLAVDTRRKTIEQGRLFRHKKEASSDQQPAEWICNIRNIHLSVDGGEQVEILDTLGLNVHGFLHSQRDGLRDVSISIKTGKFYVPYDDLVSLGRNIKTARQQASSRDNSSSEKDPQLSFAAIVEELDRPGTREESIVQAVADFREFLSSLLRGIQEIQLGIGFFRASCLVRAPLRSQSQLYLNVVTHEVGVDFHRMDPSLPAHRMYFQRNDVAHQALLAALSLSVSLADDIHETDKIMYIPMATTTIRTTLPSKTVDGPHTRDAADRNTNVLFANLVATSPAIDVKPRQLSHLMSLLHTKHTQPPRKRRDNHLLISRLLPKASIKLSVHEPVLRFVLPIEEKDKKTDYQDYNMLVSSISSLSLDIESSHSAEAGVQYSLASVARVSSHQLYYQTAAGAKHSLLATETMEVKAHLNATDEVCVVGSGYLNSFSLHLVSGEVTRGVHQVVEQFYNQSAPTKLSPPREYHKNALLRRLPPWLLEFNFEASGFDLEIAGVDESIGNTTRGIVLQLQGWTATYYSQRPEPRQKSSRRRTPSHSTMTDDPSLRFSPSSPGRKSRGEPADGRRLAVHGHGLEGFVIESADYMEPESFLSIPRFEVAFSTSTDLQGPVLHISSVIQEIMVRYSLYRYYAVGIAAWAVQNAFAKRPSKKEQQQQQQQQRQPTTSSFLNGAAICESPTSISPRAELVAVDVKTHFVQVKCTMPADPPMLLQLYGLVAGRHRWSAPFLRCQLARLHAGAPKSKGSWARIVNVSSIRLGLRETRQMPAQSFRDTTAIEISTDAIRLAVPHGMVMYRIFDNFVNTAKAMEQLHHRLKTQSEEYVLKKGPDGPKKVPRISVRTKALLFELEDDPFEWKLANIYRLGMLEQKQRIAREEAHMMKAKKVDEARGRNPSRIRVQNHKKGPSHASQRSKDTSTSGGEHAKPKSRPRASTRPERLFRYNAERVHNFSDGSDVRRDRAWTQMQQANARSWKARIKSSVRFQDAAIKEIRNLFAGADQVPEGSRESDEDVLPVPSRPGLLTVVISDVHLTLDKPSFDIEEYAEYIHKIGKGMPMDMKYALLIPMSIRLNMGEARFHLRDYPLDLIHIPGLAPGQSAHLPCWSLSSDFVIAEEFRDIESQRHVVVNIVPPSTAADGSPNPGFSVDVRRTVSPVKTYSNPTIEINTSQNTSISWGMSYQPVIQDMMKILEGFTKPEVDPSDRMGFWDKIRLGFHSRLNVVWKGDGDVHLRLKGSRDPYVVTGYGAGFVMVFRKDVQWEIHSSDDPRKFMTVTSGEYVLAVPDYSHQARHTYEAPNFGHSAASHSKSGAKGAPVFKKVVMKLSGNVRWLLGLVFERNVEEGAERCFEFRPHYDVVLKNPKFVDLEERPDYDAYGGFRSNHIHLSLAVVAPVSRVWSYSNLEPSTSYNTAHLSPRAFTHFFSWWSLFSGTMSLPIRQGPLWPGPIKSNKKFGRHLATVKYNLFLSPLFVSHVYKHKDIEEDNDNVVRATGLKVRLDSFMLDLHQRREQILPVVRGRSKQTKASIMKINRAHLDFISADCRAVSASIKGTRPEDFETSEDIPATYQQPVARSDLSRFTIPDRDFNWVDMDDFVELDWILPSESNPETQILPLAYSPRFSYFRQTDHAELGPDEPGYSPFGDEPTHHCVMSQDNDPRRVQMELIKERLQTLDSQIESHKELAGEHELRIVRDGQADEDSERQYELFLRQGESLQRRKKFLEAGLRRLQRLLAEHSNGDSPQPENADEGEFDNLDPEIDGLYASSSDEFISDFDNRFVIHNIQLKWNNSLRNIILRYIHQVSERRGFVYYMSRRAVKFMLDILEEKGKSQMRTPERPSRQSYTPSTHSAMGSEKDEEMSVQDRIEQLLNDAKKFVDADAPPNRDEHASSSSRPATHHADDIAPEFTAQNSYHLRLIAPQIQLQSEKNKKSVALVTAKGMELKVMSIMDKHRVSDDVSGLVQRKFILDMDNAQFFVATQNTFTSNLYFYCGNSYGNTPGSAWPPWVALESIFDFNLDTSGFARIIQKTSASLRYDKFNPLRLKYNEKVAASGEDEERTHNSVANENRIDSISLDFPHVRAICDSDQYYSMYIIVLDLLLYSDPLEKVRAEKLEKIMLATDFSDLRGAPEMVSHLQQRIRHLDEIKNVFQIQAKYMDKQGWIDRMKLEKDLTTCENELFVIMKAITTSQRKNEERAKAQSSGLMRWTLAASEIVWHLLKDPNQTLVEFQLRNATYERTDNIDGSNNNTIEIQRISGLNLLPNALYPEMIVPYFDEQRQSAQTENDKMLRVDWYMLEAISGIPVVNNFEVSLFPLKIQLERELGKRLFEYIFPGVGSNAFENGSFSPFMVKHVPQDDDSDSESGADNRPSAGSRSSASVDAEEAGLSGAGIQSRLKPTLVLPDKGNSDSSIRKTRDLTMTPLEKEKEKESASRRKSHGESSWSIPKQGLLKKSSTDSLRFIGRQSSDKSLVSMANSDQSEEKSKKFTLTRSSAKLGNRADKVSDDVSQMMWRASNYMILTHVKINDVVLNLSYKGKSDHNIEDIHDFVFRLPVLEYRNKSWSNLDLALRLKKDAIKALISHMPAILGNKFSYHRPTKQQQNRLRQLASTSQVLNTPDSNSIYSLTPGLHGSDAASSRGSRSSMERSDSPRFSFNSTPSRLARRKSEESSLRSSTIAPDRPSSDSIREGGADDDDENQPSSTTPGSSNDPSLSIQGNGGTARAKSRKKFLPWK